MPYQFSEETLTLSYKATPNGNRVHILYWPGNASLPDDYIQHGQDFDILEGQTIEEIAMAYMPPARKSILDQLYNNPYEDYV